jgi:hypothetical protein
VLCLLQSAPLTYRSSEILSYRLHSVELKDGAHHSATFSALKVGRLKRLLLRSVKGGGGGITNSKLQGSPFFKTLFSKLIRIFITLTEAEDA